MKKIFLFILVCISISAIAQNQQRYQQNIKSFYKYYQSGNADSSYLLFGETMKKAVTPARWNAMLPQIKMQMGSLQPFKYLSKRPGQFVYSSPAEKSAVDLMLALDSSTSLVEGFFFLPRPSTDSLSKTNITVNTPKGNLYGTLAMPAGATVQVPVVLIIAGSGPTDRNGNSSPGYTMNSYKMLAAELSKSGIASVRYDKRMIGESTDSKMKQEDVRFEDYLNDAVLWVEKLQGDSRFSKVIILGHSEGSLIGMMVAQRTKANAFVSVAGAGENAYDILKRQTEQASPAYAKAAWPILDSLKAGHTVSKVDPMVSAILDPSIQPYMISWFRYNPLTWISKLNMPVMIIQGTTDLQVTVDDARRLKVAQPGAFLKIIEGMSHIMKDGPADRQANFETYKQPDLPLNKEFVETVIDFIKRV
ncbi:MAG: Lysophospholipase, alpha-beta hydrolase superfamily [Chitinophagaceae bacterium]|nr:Lysophospholipase, alpha-beta hydrolase superfamily [Chitinophagaceae bacterium]